MTESEDDLLQLQGEWAVLSHTVQGRTVYEESNPLESPGLSLVLEGHAYSQKRGDRVINPGHFSIDPCAAPKRFDLIFSNDDGTAQVIPGIYCLVGDRLTICLGVERPAVLASSAGKFGAMWVCRRVETDGCRQSRCGSEGDR